MQNVLRALALCAIAITLTAASPSRPSFAVLFTAGPAGENERSYADAAIVNDLRSRGFVADLADDPQGNLAILGPAICASTGVDRLLGGKLSVDVMPDREINQWATAKIDIAAYDCIANRYLGLNSGSAGTFNVRWAIDRSIAAALKNFARR
jgi:hypothetical protein